MGGEVYGVDEDAEASDGQHAVPARQHARIYRPEIIPDKNRIEVMVPAPLSQRNIVESTGTK